MTSLEAPAVSETVACDLGGTIAALARAAAKTGAFGCTLENVASELERGLDWDELKTIVSTLSAAALRMEAHHRGLAERLRQAAREMEWRSVSAGAGSSIDGLADRRRFEEMLRTRIGEARANDSDLCLMMCDVDCFSRFNEAWGWRAGDQALRLVATELARNAQSDRFAAHYGGGEFVLLMPGADLHTAHAIAETFRKAIHAKRLRRCSDDADMGTLTLSVGIARLMPGESMAALVERAEICLYAAKRNGRNQTVVDAAPYAA